MINFQPVKLEHKKIFDEYFTSKRYEGSESSFTNLFMWKECYKIEWAILDSFLCIKPEMKGDVYVLPPYGSSEAGLNKVIDKLIGYFEESGYPFMMRGISPEFKDVLEKLSPCQFEFIEERDVFDYVYLLEDLVGLKGRKYSKKRNHIKNFRKSYPQYQYLPLTKDLIIPCQIRLEEWCIEKGCEDDSSLLCERDAIIAAFEAFNTLNYIGGVILIDGNVEAFTFGEALNNDTVIIHAEKANQNINGLYQTINQEYLANHWTHMKYVNREEDLGIEGLRQAKLSYYPTQLITKYQALLKSEVQHGNKDTHPKGY
ncbi:MAG: DUF2156 domain-containing protein [Bacillota bacterium]